MYNFKSLTVATLVAVGTAFAMPAASQAMPVAPVKISAAQDGNVVKADHRKKWRGDRRKWRGDKRRWRGDRWREARHWRGDRWRYQRNWRRHRYYDPYYYGGYDGPGYGYYGPGYGYYGPGYWGPGIGFQFRID